MQNKTIKNSFNAGTAIDPNVIIDVLVDTAFVYTQNTGVMYTGQGIYMVDNNVNSGSRYEGNLELFTVVGKMQTIGYNVFAIDNGVTGAVVNITGVQFSSGTNIWTANGTPTAQAPGASTCQWAGRAMQQSPPNSPMTYQIKISIGYAGLPTKYYYWDPFTSCQ